MNAYQFFKNRAIVTEIQKRERMMAERYEISREWIVERLARIADSGKTLARFKRIDAHGGIYWDFRGATKEDLEVIADLSVEEYKEGRGPGAADVKKTKITVASPLQALEGLARILGFNQDKLKVEGDLTVIEQLQAGRARIAKLRHPVAAIDAEYSEIAQKALPGATEDEEYVSKDEQPAVDPDDDDLIEW